MNSNILRSLPSSVKPSYLRHLLPKTSASFSTAASHSSRKTIGAAVRPTRLATANASTRNTHITTTFSRTMASNTKLNADTLLELIKGRRSYYALSKDLPISKDRIQEIVKEALRQVPSSFNSQSNRVVVLFGAEHDKFWGITEEVLRAIVPAENWEATDKRLAGFKGAAGSILFFADQSVVEGMQAKFALYADRFPPWAEQSIGMLEFALWTALEAEGLGANLQHYNPLVDEKVAQTWNVPSTWKLNAQLVFGGRAGEPGPKDFKPFEETYRVYGA